MGETEPLTRAFNQLSGESRVGIAWLIALTSRSSADGLFELAHALGCVDVNIVLRRRVARNDFQSGEDRSVERQEPRQFRLEGGKLLEGEAVPEAGGARESCKIERALTGDRVAAIRLV